MKHIANQKIPSKLARIIAVFGLISLGAYISYILFYTENISARMETFSWIALVGLAIFFIKLLTTLASERDKFWKLFFNGTGYASDKERREANKEMWILVVLVIIGFLFVLFLL